MSKQTERDAFRSRWGFILACIGSAVGMGNIWRFPYLVSAWGGMTFLLPYFLFVLLIGSTGIIGEMALGRSTRSGPIGAFGQAAALRGRRSTGEAVGYIPVLGSLALVIIPAMAAGGADLSDGGPGLMFIFLVNVFNGMPGGRVIGLVFFLCVLFAGLTSLVNLYEVSVEALQDKLHFKRVAAVAVIAVIGTAVSLCIQAIVSDWMDVVSIYICPLGALLAGILFFWVAGKDFVLAAVNKGAGKPIGAWFYPLSKYVYCACALLALIAGALLGGIG